MAVEQAVLERYSESAAERQEALCCPVDYDANLLKILPEEVIAKDYGCGDPSRYVQPADTVLDLGSGGGKICFMAAQIVGPEGAIHGVDMNDDMLALARKYQVDMSEKTGVQNINFHKGFIQDLALDVTAMEAWLQQNEMKTANDFVELKIWQDKQRAQKPLIADASIDLVISNCVLNLVNEKDRLQMIQEIFRVLKPGGRVAISDIVADKKVPQHLKDDPELWSGCISGAFVEDEFLNVFAQAGFYAVAYDKWDSNPWQTVEDIHFRSVTLVATKPADSSLCNKEEIIYMGPFKKVEDDFGNIFERGKRIGLSNRTTDTILNSALKDSFVATERQAKDQGCCAPESSCC